MRFCRFILFVMAIGTPFVVIEAALAILIVACGADRNARSTASLVTAFATCRAFIAMDPVAVRAILIAFAARRCLALIAGPSFVVGHGCPAVGALRTMPVGKRDVWAA